MSIVKSSKLVVMGDVSVGKTSILTRYIKDTFDQFSESTIGAAFFTKKVTAPTGENINLEIWDTAGQERYDSLLPMYYRGANIILFVFDLNNANSFSNLRTRWLDIINQSGMNSIFFLVGNKCDLQQNIQDEDVVNLLLDYDDVEYFKISAKNNEGLDELFTGIVEKAIERDAFKDINRMQSFGSLGNATVKKKYKCC